MFARQNTALQYLKDYLLEYISHHSGNLHETFPQFWLKKKNTMCPKCLDLQAIIYLYVNVTTDEFEQLLRPVWIWKKKKKKDISY